ncbi:helix-turn-helix domain-containing protein [Sporosarcina soli]|uniref:Helix-turn-helix domain-containing protein n=1 Tax=Sporosarcina soli TaxID=334736 RepID=A0ABW0TFD0_9BACL
MSIGAFLKECRNRAGFNQIKMAAVLSVSQSDISKYENDVKEPPTSVFRDWTIATQSMELGMAFLYGADVISVISNAVSPLVGFIHFF